MCCPICAEVRGKTQIELRLAQTWVGRKVNWCY